MTISHTSARVVDSGSMMATNGFTWKWRLSELPAPTADSPTVFSTFSCGGGSSMGYKRAGYKVVGCCEIDKRVLDIYCNNLHPEHPVLADLRDFNKTLRDDGVPEWLREIDVLDGSPPCSTFSISGSREKAWGKEKVFREGQAKQTLDDLFFVFLDTVELLRPKVVVAENVVGLSTGNARGYVNEILKRFHKLGYHVQMFQLNGAFMDVPQSRRRVFFVANRMGWRGLKLDFNGKPIPFGVARSKTAGEKPSPTSVIGSMARRSLPSDKDLADVCMRERGKHSLFNYKFVDDNKPCPTITANCCLIRRCDLKFLTKTDIRNCSTFPQDYDFGNQDVAFVCGMSVPPNMMANVAKQVREQWLSKR